MGRVAEHGRAVDALLAGRSVLIQGGAGMGKSHLLAHTLDTYGERRDVTTAVRARGNMALVTPDEILVVSPGAGGRMRQALADEWIPGTLLVVDDLDALPAEAIDLVVGGVVCRGMQLLSSIRPAALRADADAGGSSALETVIADGDVALIPLGAFALDATRRLGDARRRYLGETTAAEDGWVVALHRLSGGIPALIVEIVGHAFAHERMAAIEPLDVRDGLMSGALADAAQRILAGATDADLIALAILGELGSVPASHLGYLWRAETTTRLSDARLLSASTDADRVASAGLLAWAAREGVDSREWEGSSADVARRLLRMGSRGIALTVSEEVFCARYSAEIVVGELSPVERQALHGMLARAALGVARSRTPRDAIAIAERALMLAPSPAASVAVVLAAVATGDDALARRGVAALGQPADRTEADLFLAAHLALSYGPSGQEPEPRDAAPFRSWLPGNASWSALVDGVEFMLDFVSGRSDGDRGWWAGDPDPAVLEADAARRGAIEALVDAMRGRGSRALDALHRRWRSHGLDTEPQFEVFVLHAFVLVILGVDDERLRVALRRRVAAARAADRQDQLQLLALADAALHLGRSDARAMFASLQLVETEPREYITIWLDLLRACAHILERDLGRAAELLHRVDRVPGAWVGGSFGAVREIARTLFELATEQPAIAGRRALVAAYRSTEVLPAAALTLLRLAQTAGVPTDKVLERALALAEKADLPQLDTYVRSLRRAEDPTAPRSLDVLTAREREIVTMAIQGTPSAEIARRLQLSVRTVESHLHHARTRLGMQRSQRFTDIPGDVRTAVPVPILPTRSQVHPRAHTG